MESWTDRRIVRIGGATGPAAAEVQAGQDAAAGDVGGDAADDQRRQGAESDAFQRHVQQVQAAHSAALDGAAQLAHLKSRSFGKFDGTKKRELGSNQRLE